jgi:hypothetical protein
MPPKSTAAGDGGAVPPDADERARKRAKQGDAAAESTTTAADASARDASTRDSSAAAPAAPAAPAAASRVTRSTLHQQWAERSAEILFLVLERQRHAAREARMANRRELLRTIEAGEGAAAPAWHALGGCDGGAADDDGEEGAVAGAGWWRPAPHTSRRPKVPMIDADRSFLETCAASARACKAWRDVVCRAADKATLSWAGEYTHETSINYGNTTQWKRAGSGSSRSRRAGRADPLSALRAFEGGVLRALCLRGEPDDPRRLRAFVGALGVADPAAGDVAMNRGDERVASVLRGLKALRLESAGALADALAPIGLHSPLPSPPLLSALVTLDLGR